MHCHLGCCKAVVASTKSGLAPTHFDPKDFKSQITSIRFLVPWVPQPQSTLSMRGDPPRPSSKDLGKMRVCWGECGEQFPPRVGLHLGTVCSTPPCNGGLWQVQLTMAVTNKLLPGWGARGVQDTQLCQREWSQTVLQSPCFSHCKSLGT